MKRFSSDAKLVFSSELGKICSECGNPKTGCICKKHHPKLQSESDGVVRVQRETKGHAGKIVTVITGLLMNDAALKNLAAELKRLCGAGGSCKDNIVMIQGDHCERVITELKNRGLTVKKAGG